MYLQTYERPDKKIRHEYNTNDVFSLFFKCLFTGFLRLLIEGTVETDGPITVPIKEKKETLQLLFNQAIRKTSAWVFDSGSCNL